MEHDRGGTTDGRYIYLVDESDLDAMSAVKKICSAHVKPGSVVKLSKAELDAVGRSLVPLVF